MSIESFCKEIGGRMENVDRCVREVNDIREVSRYLPIICGYISRYGDQRAEFVFVDRNNNIVGIEYDPVYSTILVYTRIRSSGVDMNRVKKIIDTALENVKSIPHLDTDMVSTSIVEKVGNRAVGSTFAYATLERDRASTEVLTDLITRLIEFASNEANRTEKVLIKTTPLHSISGTIRSLRSSIQRILRQPVTQYTYQNR